MSTWKKFFSRENHPLIQQFESGGRPGLSTQIDACPLLVVDLELTGLHPKKDYIVSMGWVPIRERTIVLAEAKYHLILSPVSVGQSATIHGLHDRDLKDARPLRETLADFLKDAKGYVFAAHNARLDAAFLQHAYKRCYGDAPQMHFIDTLAIERRRLLRNDQTIKHNGLTLSACLRRHRLPWGDNHNALEDAYHCALLLLAQISQTNRPNLTLGDLLRESR